MQLHRLRTECSENKERAATLKLEKTKKMVSELSESELKEVVEETVEDMVEMWQREKAELEGELFLERERLAKPAIDAEEAEGN